MGQFECSLLCGSSDFARPQYYTRVHSNFKSKLKIMPLEDLEDPSR
jgi:hypothetical protein